MIFRLTNIAVIFYAIVNNLLRNLINSSSIAFFINNISVAMDIDKQYDEILGKVLIKRYYKGWISIKKLVLIIPGLNRNLILEANILYFAIGKILKIRCEDKRWELVTLRI